MSNSVGPVEAGTAGDAAAMAAAAPPRAAPLPLTAAGQRVDRPLAQREGGGAAPLPPLPSAQTSKGSTAPGPAEVGDNTGLELLDASELVGAEAAGFLDAVDALLGEAILEGFGEGSSEEDMLPFFEGNI